VTSVGATNAIAWNCGTSCQKIEQPIFVREEHVVHMPKPYITQKFRIGRAAQHALGIDDRRIRNDEQVSIVVNVRNREEAVQMLGEFVADLIAMGGVELTSTARGWLSGE